MNELLLQTLTEAVESLKKGVQETQKMIKELPNYSPGIEKANQRMDAIQKEIGGIPGRISIPEKDLRALNGELERHGLQLKQPQQIRHHHHLSKPLIACIVLVAISITLGVFLIQVWKQVGRHQDADIKYRYLKLSKFPESIAYLKYIDSIYLSNPSQMRKDVEKEEQHREDLLEASERLKEDSSKVQQLEGVPKGYKTKAPKRKTQ